MRGKRAGHNPGEHRRKQLVAAADWAITKGWNDTERRANPRTPERLTVHVQDVIDRAAQMFNLTDVGRDEAAKVLRDRLEHRGWAYVHGLLTTDAW